MANEAKNKDFGSLAILKKIEANEFDPKDLKRADRIKLVAVLRQSYSQAEIAKILKCGDRTIERDVDAIKTQAGKLVQKITVDKVIGELIRKAEVLYSKAFRNGELALAWTIAGGLVTKLQSLGVVTNNPTTPGAQIHIGDKHEHTTLIEVGQLTKDMKPEELRGIDELCRKSLSRANPPQPSPVEHGMPNN